jgi:hypothetical protein
MCPTVCVPWTFALHVDDQALLCPQMDREAMRRLVVRAIVHPLDCASDDQVYLMRRAPYTEDLYASTVQSKTVACVTK